MAVVKHPPFPAGTLEHTCKLIADLYSGSELTRIMTETPSETTPARATPSGGALHTPSAETRPEPSPVMPSSR